MTVQAVDYDDPAKGSNARLSYALEKNAIEATTGKAIFSVDKITGDIRTAVCCLDRETTHQYSIHVVVMDGGGLKGKIIRHFFTVK